MIEIRKSFLPPSWGYAPWQWYCGACHYADHMPWRDAASFEDAWLSVDRHIAQHREIGQRLEWIPVRD